MHTHTYIHTHTHTLTPHTGTRGIMWVAVIKRMNGQLESFPWPTSVTSSTVALLKCGGYLIDNKHTIHCEEYGCSSGSISSKDFKCVGLVGRVLYNPLF